MKNTIHFCRAFLIMKACIFSIGIGYAQTEYGAFTATGSGMPVIVVSDYQCLGINPANLGWNADNHKWHFGIVGLSVSGYTDAVTKSDLNLLYEDHEYTLAEKEEAARRFSDSRLSFDLGINGIGLSYQDPDIGGFAFTVRERGSFNMHLNSSAAELLWLGFNSDYFDQKVIEQGLTIAGISSNPKPVAELFKGTSFSSAWLRDFILGYGRQIVEISNWSLYGGLSLKYTMGFAWVDIFVDESKFFGYSAMSPVFKFEYPQPTPSLDTNGKLRPSGKGFAFDLGLSARYKNLWRFGLSLNDIGTMTWNKNVYSASFEATIRKIETPGLGNENINEVFDAIVIEDDLMQWEGLNNKKASYPSQIRLGVAYTGVSHLIIGSEVMIPLNKVPGAQERPVYSLGMQASPLNRFFFSAGFQTGGNYDFHIPIGFSVKPVPGWEIGLATQDISVLFRDVSPYLSLSFGFMRFSFTRYQHNEEIPSEQ